jgi:hypothetical protein
VSSLGDKTATLWSWGFDAPCCHGVLTETLHCCCCLLVCRCAFWPAVLMSLATQGDMRACHGQQLTCSSTGSSLGSSARCNQQQQQQQPQFVPGPTLGRGGLIWQLADVPPSHPLVVVSCCGVGCRHSSVWCGVCMMRTLHPQGCVLMQGCVLAGALSWQPAVPLKPVDQAALFSSVTKVVQWAVVVAQDGAVGTKLHAWR